MESGCGQRRGRECYFDVDKIDKFIIIIIISIMEQQDVFYNKAEFIETVHYVM